MGLADELHDELHDEYAREHGAQTRRIASEVMTVGELRRVLAGFTDEAELSRSVSITYHMDLDHGSKIRIRED